MNTVELTVRDVWEVVLEADDSTEHNIRIILRDSNGIVAQVNVEASQPLQIARSGRL